LFSHCCCCFCFYFCCCSCCSCCCCCLSPDASVCLSGQQLLERDRSCPALS